MLGAREQFSRSARLRARNLGHSHERGQSRTGRFQPPQRRRGELATMPHVGRHERAELLRVAVGGDSQLSGRRQRQLNRRQRVSKHETELTYAQVQQPALVSVVHGEGGERERRRHRQPDREGDPPAARELPHRRARERQRHPTLVAVGPRARQHGILVARAHACEA